MEYCNGGDLLERLVELGTMNENQAGRIVDQVLSGLGYLHNNNIVHRDLKPANLIFANKQEDACIKIIDFGLSKKFGVNRLHTVVGTPYYIAPEVLSKKYGTECDI